RRRAGGEGGPAREPQTEKIRRSTLTDRKGRRVSVEREGATSKQRPPKQRPPKQRPRRYHGRNAGKREQRGLARQKSSRFLIRRASRAGNPFPLRAEVGERS